MPYYWLGIKMYDLVSGGQILKSSYFLNRSRSMEIFPHLKEDKLKGALVYYDGELEILSPDANLISSLEMACEIRDLKSHIYRERLSRSTKRQLLDKKSRRNARAKTALRWSILSLVYRLFSVL